jgi:hypothetical protein
LKSKRKQLSYQSDIAVVKELNDVVDKIGSEILKQAQQDLPKEYYITTSFSGNVK